MESGTIVALGFGVLLLAGGACAAIPQYNVYSARADGEAKLAEAQSSRQIAVLEAKAKQDAARDLANAEITRAEGVAQANKIIGDSLRGNDAYLRYLWIQTLDQNGKDQVVYIPTEANLPILESSRLLTPPMLPPH